MTSRSPRSSPPKAVVLTPRERPLLTSFYGVFVYKHGRSGDRKVGLLGDPTGWLGSGAASSGQEGHPHDHRFCRFARSRRHGRGTSPRSSPGCARPSPAVAPETSWRRQQLRALEQLVTENEAAIAVALETTSGASPSRHGLQTSRAPLPRRGMPTKTSASGCGASISGSNWLPCPVVAGSSTNRSAPS